MRRCGWLMTILLAMPAAVSAQASSGDEWLRRPVDDRTYAGFLPFFNYDTAVPLAIQTGARDEFQGVAREHVTFQSTPGVRVTARIYRAAAPGGGWILFLHGGGASGKDGPRPLNALFARAGWNVLAIDLLHFGERKTDLLNEYTEAEKHEKLYNQPAAHLGWVAQTVKDVGRSVDYLIQERRADPRRIVLVGISRGAQMALIAGAVDQRFRAVAALYGGHFDAFETGHLPAACPANYIGRISPRPLFLMNGTMDEDYARAVSVDPLHRLAGNPKQIVWLETGHTMPPAEALAQVTRWLDQAVR